MKTLHLNRTRRLQKLGLFTITSMLMHGLLQATTLSWNAPFGGEINDAGNWLPSQLPDADSALQFTNEAEGTITLNSDLSITSLLVGNGPSPLDFDFTGRVLTLLGSGVNFDITTGSVVQFTGGTINGAAAIRLRSGGGNNLTLSGTEVNSTATFRMEADNAILTLQNGAILNVSANVTDRHRIGGSSSSNNALTVNGSGTAFITNGGIDMGQGTGATDNSLIIENGGSFTAGDDVRLGGVGSIGAETLVTGSGSSLIVNGIASMRGSESLLRVEAGANMTVNSTFTIGATNNITDNRVVVDAATMTLQELRFGTSANSAENVMVIRNGGQLNVTGTRVRLGWGDASSDALLQVESGGIASFPATPLEFGFNGEVVIDGGSLFTSNVTTVEPTPTGDIILNLREGLVGAAAASVNQHMDFSFGDADASAAAVYRLTNASGTHTFANPVIMQSNARLEGSGNFDTELSAAAAGAVIAPGVGTDFGVLNIASLANDNITLTFKLGDFSSLSPVAGEDFDQINVLGEFTAGGTLFLDLDSFLTSATETTVQLLAWDTLNGNTGSIDVQLSDPGAPLDWSFEADGFYVTAVPEPSVAALLAGIFAAIWLFTGRLVQRRRG